MTYKIVRTVDGYEGIQCLLCELISFNRNDIENKYCGHCHIFHEDSPTIHNEKEIARAVEVKNLFKKLFD